LPVANDECWAACGARVLCSAYKDGLVHSVGNLGYLLRLRRITDVRWAFTWELQDRSRGWVYAKTMLPSAFTALGALLFAEACIMTAHLRFGDEACIGASVIGVPRMIAGGVLLVCVIMDNWLQHANATLGPIAPMTCAERTNSSKESSRNLSSCCRMPLEPCPMHLSRCTGEHLGEHHYEDLRGSSVELRPNDDQLDGFPATCECTSEAGAGEMRDKKYNIR